MVPDQLWVPDYSTSQGKSGTRAGWRSWKIWATGYPATQLPAGRRLYPDLTRVIQMGYEYYPPGTRER